jgi:hypothetical protein
MDKFPPSSPKRSTACKAGLIRRSDRRIRSCALWEGWHGYHRKKYRVMLRGAFEPLMKVLGLSSTPLTVQEAVNVAAS